MFITFSISDCHFHENSIESAVDTLIGRAHLVCTLYTENFEADGDHKVIRPSAININYPSDCDEPDNLAFGMLLWNEREDITLNVASCRSLADDNAHWIKMRDGLRTGLDPRTNDLCLS